MEEGSTQNSGPHQFADKAPSPARKDRAGVVRTARAIVRLARARAENVNGLLITLRVTNSTTTTTTTTTDEALHH